MRVLAAIVALAACSCRLHAHAQTSTPRDHLPRALLTALGVTNQDPVHRLLTCGRTLGPTKCLSALSAWRAENAAQTLEEEGNALFNITADVERFPWEQYRNRSDEQLYSQLCDGAEKLLRYRPLTFNMIPGYSLELESKGNGKLSFDLLKNTDTVTGRGSMKKLQKQFYNIVPYLLVPGLIMSAILPFLLPALKMMTIGAVMINNMALTGAVFTLLRNNAFNDYHYNHKVIYENEGYKNEKASQAYFQEVETPLEHDEHYGDSNLHGIIEGPTNDQYVVVEDYPTNADWINQYYGNDGAVQTQVKRSSQRNGSRRKNLM